MLYTILITVVFIAELIITLTIIRALWKFDKILISADSLISEAKPGIRDITELGSKISEQLVEFAEDFCSKAEEKKENTLVNILNKSLIALLLWKLNSKTIRKIRRSKYFRLASKGFNLIQNMI